MTRPAGPDPLQPDERELAEALARTASSQGPSACLDAAIIAAARGAAADRAASVAGVATGALAPPGTTGPARAAAAAHRSLRRSPAWLRGGALAATLVVAVGVAWQMKPHMEPYPVSMDAGEAPVAAVRAERAAGTPAVEPAHAPPAARDAARQAMPAAGRPVASPPDTFEPGGAPAEAPVRPAPAPAPAPTLAPQPHNATPRAPKALPEADSAPPVVFGRIEPTAAPASPPAPPSPPAPVAAKPGPLRALPPPPPAGSRARSEQQSADAGFAPPPATGASAARGDADDTGTHDEDGAWFDQPLDDTPPASVDSPAVREAWLARIRELVAAERYDEARASFAEFRRRHPEAPLPEGLRSLLEE
ncbi:hypothetical protein WCE41_07575 [Luteimonas sp. MJ246]|uniref:hypothetical protein n=1 Tax=Luteimonas sp. MJ174 TaxID=3129237 RepID=UPI0031BAE269